MGRTHYEITEEDYQEMIRLKEEKGIEAVWAYLDDTLGKHFNAPLSDFDEDDD